MRADSSRDRVVLFDIDGTLVRTDGAGGRALNGAWRGLFGEHNAFEGISFVGGTDEKILDQVFLRWRDNVGSRGDREALLERYLQLLPEEIAKGNYTVNPGVREALTALKPQGSVAVGLATGNVEAAARLKLAPGELNPHFRFGGYGSDAADRAELTEMAARRAEDHIGRKVPRDQVVVVGDSIHDVRAAHAIGALSVAVCTGWTPHEVLERERPTLLKEVLDSRGDWLRELGLLEEG